MRDFARRALRHRSFVTGGVLVAVLLACSLLSLVWSPWPPAEIDIPNKLAPPSAAHWTGIHASAMRLRLCLMICMNLFSAATKPALPSKPTAARTIAKNWKKN